jgi:transposase, IS5 family
MDFFSYNSEERIGKDNDLIKMRDLIEWERFAVLIKGLYKNEETDLGGQRPYDPIKMLKATILGQWHNLSDPELENALKIRLDFMLFTGFSITEKTPDETTLCRFRNRLTDKGLTDKILSEVNRQLEEYGLKVKSCKGAIIDASVIESAARPKRTIEVAQDRKENEITDESRKQEPEVVIKESADKDARYLKKGKKFYYGYKVFVSVDSKDGYIQNTHTTPANESEVVNLKNIIKPDINRLYADKGYASEDNRNMLRDRNIKDGIMSKASRCRELTPREKRRNKLISRVRYKVEQAFGTLKRKFQFSRARYFSTRKVHSELNLKSVCFNLLKAIRKIVSVELLRYE